jgi:site-specific recombinase XerD
MNSTTPSLGAVLESFFNDHLKLQKGLRPNSITSYADAIRLFLQFAADAAGKRITQLGFEDLDMVTVSRFLNSLEECRGNKAQSRNQRLAAIRTFFEYVGGRLPDRLAQAQRVAAIPRKRALLPETVSLERDEIESTLTLLPADKPSSLRDRTLLLFLYNTGARVQEVVDLSAKDITFDPTPCVRLHGKGDKWRTCPLWPETAALLKKALCQQGSARPPDEPVFTSARGTALTRFGIYKIVGRCTTHIVKKGSDGRTRRITPHVWRHTTATHLLESGVELNTVRGWLGHERLETTNRYAEISLRSKQAALEKCTVPTGANNRIPEKPAWQSDGTLLAWLRSL